MAETAAPARTVEDELVELTQRALADRTLAHPIVGVAVVLLYADGGVATVQNVGPDHAGDLANGAVLLEKRLRAGPPKKP